MQGGPALPRLTGSGCLRGFLPVLVVRFGESANLQAHHIAFQVQRFFFAGTNTPTCQSPSGSQEESSAPLPT
eukprot:1891625-Amphidinium_carterae.1